MVLTMMLMATTFTVWGQDDSTAVKVAIPDYADEGKLDPTFNDIISWSDSTDAADFRMLAADSLPSRRLKRDWNTWKPDPKRALWLAIVLPGAGQIYNRKYWKLPLVYGGFVGCIYAMRWNNMMYKDYAQAYLDLMDDDPGTASYNNFMHLNKTINSSNEERYKTLFKKRKDRYRRWRDMSFFVLLGVYAVSVIDAYVDAELSAFDLSKDLSLKVRPTVIGNGSSMNPLTAASLGVNCSINF